MKKIGWIVLLVISLLTAVSAFGDDALYIIGPEDVLEISVWRDESLSREVIVPPDGVISFPLIGEIDVNKMTTTALKREVTKKLSEYVPDVTVTVILKQINSLKVYVIGKVEKPGEYSIAMDSNVMQILAKAGGLNPFAAEGKIHILRRVKETTVKIPFSYDQILKGKNLEQNIILKRGDVVVVP